MKKDCVLLRARARDMFRTAHVDGMRELAFFFCHFNVGVRRRIDAIIEFRMLKKFLDRVSIGDVQLFAIDKNNSALPAHSVKSANIVIPPMAIGGIL